MNSSICSVLQRGWPCTSSHEKCRQAVGQSSGLMLRPQRFLPTPQDRLASKCSVFRDIRSRSNSQRRDSDAECEDGDQLVGEGWRHARRAFLAYFATTATAASMVGMQNAHAIDLIVPLCSGCDSAASVLAEPNWPPSWPYQSSDFERYDESNDLDFYSEARLVYHVNDPARMALTEWYRNNLPQGPDVSICDLCSSWITHYPSNLKAKRISAQGMNAEELKANSQLSDFIVKDLNADPQLPFEDETFDAVTCALSVDYLTCPRQVFSEVARVLKPGGLAAIAFSNRLFFTKATSVWIGTSDLERVWMVGSFFHYADLFDTPEAYDLHPKAGPFGKKPDPMYVVTARKKS